MRKRNDQRARRGASLRPSAAAITRQQEENRSLHSHTHTAAVLLLLLWRRHRRPDARLVTPRARPPGYPKRRGFDGCITKTRRYAVGGAACNVWLKQRCKWVKKSRTRKKAKKLVGTFIFGRGVTRVLVASSS